jgi:hypothetical protein
LARIAAAFWLKPEIPYMPIPMKVNITI